MSDWRKSLYPASFRGIPFECQSVRKRGSQRYAAHPLISLDGQYSEPLGRGATLLEVEAFVIGSDYVSDRNKLEKALDESSAGYFVDPFRGTPVLCMVSSYEVSEGITEGMGWARFRVTYEETLPDPWGEDLGGLSDAVTSLQNAQSRAPYSIGLADAALSEWAETGLADVSEWAWVVDQTVTGLTDELDQIEALIINGPAAALISTLADLVDSLQDLRDAAADVIAAPSTLQARLQVVFDQIDSLVALEGFTDRAFPGASSTYDTEDTQAYWDALSTLQRTSALCGLSRQGTLLLDEEFSSYDEAISARDRYASKLSEALDGLSEDSDLYQKLQDVRAYVTSALDELATKLPELRTLTVTSPTSSLELAHRLYGDTSRASEIEARNNVVHPGFLQGTLRVLAV